MRGYESSDEVMRCIWSDEKWVWVDRFGYRQDSITIYDLESISEFMFKKNFSGCKKFHSSFEKYIFNGNSIVKEIDNEILSFFSDSDILDADYFAELLGFSRNENCIFIVKVKFIYGKQLNCSELNNNDLISYLKTKSFCRLFEIWKNLPKEKIESGLAVKNNGFRVLGGLLGAFNNRALKKENEKWILSNLDGLKCENTYRFLTDESIQIARKRAKELKHD